MLKCNYKLILDFQKIAELHEYHIIFQIHTFYKDCLFKIFKNFTFSFNI